MSFERFNIYKKVAALYEGEKLSLDELAIKLKKECPYAWIKVRSNNKTIYPGEKRVEGYNPITNEPDPGAVWMYRPNDKYDDILFANLIIQFQPMIYNTYKSIKNYITEDDYLDKVESFICQSIRHFDPTKNCKFKSLVYKMIKFCAINCINTNAIHKIQKDELGNRCKDANNKLIKEVIYKSIPQSLEEIIEAEDDRKYSLPYSLPKDNTLSLLKDKYILDKNLIAWCIIDLFDDNSELQQLSNIKKLLTQKDISFRLSSIKMKNIIYNLLQTPNISETKIFDFDIPQMFTKIDKEESDINIKEKQKTKIFNRCYKEAIKTLQQDVVEYNIGG